MLAAITAEEYHHVVFVTVVYLNHPEMSVTAGPRMFFTYRRLSSGQWKVPTPRVMEL